MSQRLMWSLVLLCVVFASAVTPGNAQSANGKSSPAAPDTTSGPSFAETVTYVEAKVSEFGPHLNTWFFERDYNGKSGLTDKVRVVEESVEVDQVRQVLILRRRNENRRESREHGLAFAEGRVRVVIPLANLSVSVVDANPVLSQYWANLEKNKLIFSSDPEANTRLRLKCADNTNCMQQYGESLRCEAPSDPFWSEFCAGPRTNTNSVSAVYLWMRAYPADQPERLKKALEHLAAIARESAPKTRELF